MKPEEQLEKWVNGEGIHNTERDECCPDFSCCGGEMVERSVRERFAKAYKEKDESTVAAMLMMFLSGAFPKAHIIGFEE